MSSPCNVEKRTVSTANQSYTNTLTKADKTIKKWNKTFILASTRSAVVKHVVELFKWKKKKGGRDGE